MKETTAFTVFDWQKGTATCTGCGFTVRSKTMRENYRRMTLHFCHATPVFVPVDRTWWST